MDTKHENAPDLVVCYVLNRVIIILFFYFYFFMMYSVYVTLIIMITLILNFQFISKRLSIKFFQKISLNKKYAVE